MFPDPAKAKATAFVAELRFNVLPFSKTKSSFGPPEIVIVLVVVALEVKVRLVLLVIFICPTVKLTLSIIIDNVPPGVVSAPSIIYTSEVAHAVGAEPVPSAEVFQLENISQFVPVKPVQ